MPSRVVEEELETTGLSDFLGVNFSVNTFLTERIGETVAGYAAPVVINLFGPDLDNLDRDAYAIAATLSGIRGAADVQVQAPPGLPQFRSACATTSCDCGDCSPPTCWKPFKRSTKDCPLAKFIAATKSSASP